MTIYNLQIQSAIILENNFYLKEGNIDEGIQVEREPRYTYTRMYVCMYVCMYVRLGK